MDKLILLEKGIIDTLLYTLIHKNDEATLKMHQAIVRTKFNAADLFLLELRTSYKHKWGISPVTLNTYKKFKTEYATLKVLGKYDEAVKYLQEKIDSSQLFCTAM